jgi:hypothetical protein
MIKDDSFKFDALPDATNNVAPMMYEGKSRKAKTMNELSKFKESSKPLHCKEDKCLIHQH